MLLALTKLAVLVLSLVACVKIPLENNNNFSLLKIPKEWQFTMYFDDYMFIRYYLSFKISDVGPIQMSNIQNVETPGLK